LKGRGSRKLFIKKKGAIKNQWETGEKERSFKGLKGKRRKVQHGPRKDKGRYDADGSQKGGRLMQAKKCLPGDALQIRGQGRTSELKFSPGGTAGSKSRGFRSEGFQKRDALKGNSWKLTPKKGEKSIEKSSS